MKKAKLNPIVEGEKSELGLNQILLEREDATGKILLYQSDDNGNVVPITPNVTSFNNLKPVVNMSNNNEFKSAFEAFYNTATPVKKSAFGTQLYAWKNGTTLIYTATTTIVTTEGNQTPTYDSAYNTRSKPVTDTSGTGAEQTITSNNVVYTREESGDMKVADFDALFAILKAYIPSKSDTIHNPNVVNAHGTVSADEKTVKIAADEKYMSIVVDTTKYTITKGTI